MSKVCDLIIIICGSKAYAQAYAAQQMGRLRKKHSEADTEARSVFFAFFLNSLVKSTEIFVHIIVKTGHI